MLLCDGGGSNSASKYVFKQDLQDLANRLGLEIRLAHNPPYCSKYNPIEHRMFPHVTRACQGVILDTPETAQHYLEKTSYIHTLYDADSADEHIYGKLDWDETTGVDRNRFFLWNGDDEPIAQPGPPRTPLPTEEQVDAESLVPSGPYPGRYEGMELSCDTRSNVSNAAGQFAMVSGDLAAAVLRVKGGGGRFRVTPRRQPDKGADATRLVKAIKTLRKASKSISRIVINVADHAVYREGGQLFFLCALNKGLEFPPDPPAVADGVAMTAPTKEGSTAKDPSV